jgi:hypothetical protein
MNNIQLNGLINKEGKRRELSCIEYPFRCSCGNDLFIPIHQLQKIKLENEETLRPKSILEKYMCSSCHKIFANY